MSRGGRPLPPLALSEDERRTPGAEPEAATRQSTRGRAREVSMSPAAVARIWRAFGLKPHRAETFKLSAGPLFVEEVRDVVGPYLDAPDRAQPRPPMEPGEPGRHTRDYARRVTASLLAAPDVATGEVIGKCHRRRRARPRPCGGGPCGTRSNACISPRRARRGWTWSGGSSGGRGEAHRARVVPQREGAGGGDPGAPGASRHRSQAVRPDRDGRLDPEQTRSDLRANL